MTVPYFDGTLAILLDWLSRSQIRSIRFMSFSDSKSDEKTERRPIKQTVEEKVVPS